MGHNEKSHGPGNDLQDVSKQQPAHQFGHRREFFGIEQNNEDGCKQHHPHNHRASEKQGDVRLLIDQLIGGILIGGAGGKMRIEVYTHGVQNEVDIKNHH